MWYMEGCLGHCARAVAHIMQNQAFCKMTLLFYKISVILQNDIFCQLTICKMEYFVKISRSFCKILAIILQKKIENEHVT